MRATSISLVAWRVPTRSIGARFSRRSLTYRSYATRSRQSLLQQRAASPKTPAVATGHRSHGIPPTYPATPAR